jgi:hypothetical protein
MGQAAGPPKIPPGRWAAVQVQPIAEVPPGVAMAVGFDTTRDRSSGSIAVAWRGRQGLRCELADTRPGTGWMAERLTELAQRWTPVGIAYPADSPALDIADTLATAGLPVAPIRGRDWAAACAAWLQAIVERRIRIGAHPALASAAEVAPGHASGDGGWTWYRRGTTAAIAPVIAATAATWALEHPSAGEVASWTAF